ncbi:MAG: Flp pilus assembly protein CpaB [Phycisphaerae bacterium]|jgi:pilus assembly protein CpaB
MNVKALIPLVAGLAIGGFALKMGLDTLQKAKGTPAATKQVWAAQQDIPRGSRISEEMLSAVSFPAKLVPTGAFTEKDKLLGRVPRMDAPAGLPVLENMLLPEGQPAGVHVPTGYRAVAVKIDESSGVDYHLEPGCHVDVVGYFKLRVGGRDETVARTVLEDVEVAAVGARLSVVTAEGEEKSTRPTRAVTLLVKPDKVPVLLMAEQTGKIKLSMRGEDDGESMGESRPITAEEVREGRRPEEPEEPQVVEVTPAVVAVEPTPEPVAAPPVEPEWVVYEWRGGELQVVRFKNRDSRERVVEDKGRNPGTAQGWPRGDGYVPAPAPAQPVAAPATAAVADGTNPVPAPQKATPASSLLGRMFKSFGSSSAPAVAVPATDPEGDETVDESDQDPEEPKE